MTELDTAFIAAKQDDQQKPAFYHCFLNTEFYIPTQQALTEGDDSIQPLLVESSGLSYLMLFDSEQRLKNWARQELAFAVLAGHRLVESMDSQYHWALNVGTDYAKHFVPAEIDWLKQQVAKNRSEQQQTQQQSVSSLVRVPKDLPEGFLATLQQLFSRHKDIERAYLAQVLYAIKDEPAHLTLVIEPAGNMGMLIESLKAEIATATRTFFQPEDKFDLMLHGQSNVANEIVKGIKPFYQGTQQ
jgi:peptidyl-prolyl cis-trans isomerase C